ncbi:TPA: 23S rRNA methyltransferase attenuation leader peptide [Enterococcus faecium]|nr:23S rRNA methyltransferase attenuation leader peptide [Enterococcus faecium]MCJ2456229.1 23S rRNA methyltransferase attenuation leader peptide [Enterococcus faecium]HBK4957608.1 23S rRNA methyltransferase attenuation leader peptide [Enterococcus faecium]HBK4969231.1 23S rRNA methyltransferase attenuation leader peptide [Enterococcus faecium]HBK4992413.1 23S rRNA methyltransferase attenuation leader peptide [Enterococcus faecium]HBK5050805.1 23S rRNA methyltransferase attenuation leader pept
MLVFQMRNVDKTSIVLK